MNPDQKMVATIGLILILFVIFGIYKGELSSILFGDPGGSPLLPSVPQSGTNPTGTSPVITSGGFNPNLGGISLPTIDGPPAPQSVGLGSLKGITA